MKGFLLETGGASCVAMVLVSCAHPTWHKRDEQRLWSHHPNCRSAWTYWAMTIGARQKFAFAVVGSTTVTWQSYLPGLRPAELTLKLNAVTPRRVAASGL